MKLMSIFLASTMFISIFSVNLYPQHGNPHGGSHHVVVIPRHLEVGDAIYDASVSGFRDYLDEIQYDQKEVFMKMDPYVSNLESDGRMAWGIRIVSILSGLALAGYGLTREEEVPLGETTTTQTSPNWAIVGVGAGIFFIGSIVSMVLMPGNSEFRGLLNRHNRITNPGPKNKMKLKIGMTPENHDYYSGISTKNNFYYLSVSQNF